MADDGIRASVEKQGWWGRNWRKVVCIAVVAAGGWALLGKPRNALELAETIGLAGLLGLAGTTAPEMVAAPSMELPEAAPQPITSSHRGLINGGDPFSVSGHVRNLPEGRHPSEANRALAEALGITLEEHQCYVHTYTKNV